MFGVSYVGFSKRRIRCQGVSLMQPSFFKGVVDNQEQQHDGCKYTENDPYVFHWWVWEDVREDSTRFSRTAFVATTMEETDMRSAAISGRNDQPREL